MEPLRPQVDRLILEFVRSHTFAPSDFVLGANGICRGGRAFPVCTPPS